MFYKNGIWGKTLRAIFGVVALSTVAGGLVSCDLGGGDDDNDNETEQQNRGEENDDDDDD